MYRCSSRCAQADEAAICCRVGLSVDEDAVLKAVSSLEHTLQQVLHFYHFWWSPNWFSNFKAASWLRSRFTVESPYFLKVEKDVVVILWVTWMER